MFCRKHTVALCYRESTKYRDLGHSLGFALILQNLMSSLPCEDKFCRDKIGAQRNASTLYSLVLTYVLSQDSDVLTLILSFLFRTKRICYINIYSCLLQALCQFNPFSHLFPKLILIKVGQRSVGFDLPAGTSETSLIANKSSIQKARVSPGHLPAHCPLAIR